MVISLTSCMGFNRNGSPGEKGGERLKIYTKTGDAGETGLFGGGRTSKDSPRVAAYGEVDELNAALGLGRTVCRRAERAVVAVARHERISPAILRYLNRLSDLLFVLARAANAHAGRPDVKW